MLYCGNHKQDAVQEAYLKEPVVAAAKDSLSSMLAKVEETESVSTTRLEQQLAKKGVSGRRIPCPIDPSHST